MEFVGNKINKKTILATLIVAFFIGRINLFSGCFAASIALISVMLGVSKVYIYLVPILWLSMMTYMNSGLQSYGDLATILFCGVFFLFFNEVNFTVNQRTAIAIAVAISINCAYYIITDSMVIFNVPYMVKEAVLILVFIRVFDTISTQIFKQKRKDERDGNLNTAIQITLAAVVSGFGQEYVTFGLWLFIFAFIEEREGLGRALSFLLIVGIFLWALGWEMDWKMLFVLAGVASCGGYVGQAVPKEYSKVIYALFNFLGVYFSSNFYIYPAAIAMAIFAVIPEALVNKIICSGQKSNLTVMADNMLVKRESIKTNLKRKKEAFDWLGKLYGGISDSKQIISYQFQGMSRTVEGILEDLNSDGKKERLETEKKHRFITGSAGYAFGEISGDSKLAFQFDNYKGLLISDGMGKGEKAANLSGLVVSTLSKLLSVGFDVDIAMKTVNAILMSKENTDIFATVDLALIDMDTGKTKIFKMGAASTFVKHKDQVRMIKNAALPVGITGGMKLEYNSVKLTKGDMLVMVSDGLCDCDRKDPGGTWITQRLMEISSKDPETVSELLVNKAAENYGIRERDDLTVLAATCLD